jgi:hypothetical protein
MVEMGEERWSYPVAENSALPLVASMELTMKIL